MSVVRNRKTSKKEKAIDNAVMETAFNNELWENEAQVTPKTVPTSIRLSPRTIRRAKLFARVHRQRGYQSWLKKIIEDRIETEYDIYKGIHKNGTK
jgi:hypothetical protein